MYRPVSLTGYTLCPRVTMSRFVRSVLLSAVLVAALSLVWCGSAHADGLPEIHTSPLVPLDSPGFVRLSAYVLQVELACADDTCIVTSRQTLQLHNRDRIERATFSLGFAPSVPNAYNAASVLRTAEGAFLAPDASSGGGAAPVWHLDLGRDEHVELVYETKQTLSTDHYVIWHLHAAELARWGLIEGTRISFREPTRITDDCLIEVAPAAASFDGYTLIWEEESLHEPVDHTVTMIAPQTWEQLGELRRAGAHAELVPLLRELDADAREAGIPYAEAGHQVLGELLAAILDQPDDLDLRRDLARVWRELAKDEPELALNYLLLSAQQLEEIASRQPDDAQVAAQLTEVYRLAALEASDRGDPAGALTYWQKARPENDSAGEPDLTSQKLRLRWAIDMAEQGQVAQAIDQLQDAFSLQTRDALLRYAPPLVSVHTQVDLGPGERVTTYRFRLYIPTIATGRATLEEIADLLRESGGMLGHGDDAEVELLHDGDASILIVRVAYDACADLAIIAKRLIRDLSSEDVLHVIVAAPWLYTPRDYGIISGFLQDRYLYQEDVDLSALNAVWATESDYVRWRLIELQNAPASDELVALEHRLAAIALREQRHVWDQMVTSSYWTYAVAHDAVNSQPSLSWRVTWGQARTLRNERVLHHWSRIARVVGVGLIVMVVASIVLRPAKGRARR